MNAHSQAHSDFKTFINDGSVLPATLLASVAEFVKANKLCPKSLGVEYLEKKDKTVLTLGYRSGEPACEIKLTAVELGVLDLVPDVIERAMSKAASEIGGVICHEFYVTDQDVFVAVFMSLV
jgi:hypothetical protein